MNIRLRIATPQDAQLIHDTYGHYVLTSTATFNEVNSSVEARAEEIRSQLELYPWLIAEDETGRYLGYACAEAFRPQTGYRYFAELTIFLAPDAPRRSGIGRRLYQALLPCLARQGFRQVVAVITSTNEGSLALHRSFGFTEAARLVRSGYKHGQWLTAVWMVKQLNSFDPSPAPITPFCQCRAREITRDEPLEGMDAFFDARVDNYEIHMARWETHYRWMARLLPPGICTLLDLGCGTGLELGPIFRRFPDLSVTGVDLSADMLKRLARKHTEKRLSLLCADYFACDLGKSRFDAAVSFETLHHYTVLQKTALFAKVRCALKPGGCYLQCDYIATSQAMEDAAMAECARRRIRDRVPEDAFVHFDTPLTLAHEMQALRDAGFATVELRGFLPGDDHTAMLMAVK